MARKISEWAMVLVGASLAVALTPSAVLGDPLFKPAPEPAAEQVLKKPQIPREAILRFRLVLLRMDELKKNYQPRPSAKSEKGRLVLNLFDDLSLIAITQRVKWKSATDFTWVGLIEGTRPGRAVFIVRKGKLFGNVRVGRMLYQIRPRGEGRHVVLEIDTAKLPDEHQDPIEVDGEQGPDDGTGSDSDAGPRHPESKERG